MISARIGACLTTTPIEAKRIVIVEGILIFAEPRLLEQMDIKVFCGHADDIRFIRRLKRTSPSVAAP